MGVPLAKPRVVLSVEFIPMPHREVRTRKASRSLSRNFVREAFRSIPHASSPDGAFSPLERGGRRPGCVAVCICIPTHM